MLQLIIDAISARPAGSRLVFLSDFDGTLADFDDDPAAPRAAPDTQRLLEKLAGRADLSMGIVSGRLVDDLRARTALPAGVYLAGLHGLEIAVGADCWRHPELDAARDDIRDLAKALAGMRAQPGFMLEDKDAAVAAHVRRVPEAARATALAEVDTIAAPWVARGVVRRLAGHLVLEFLPNLAWHKGDATRWIARDVEQRSGHPPWVVFVGDDVTDEDAFAAVEQGISVSIGARASAANYQLGSTSDVQALLAWLAEDNRP